MSWTEPLIGGFNVIQLLLMYGGTITFVILCWMVADKKIRVWYCRGATAYELQINSVVFFLVRPRFWKSEWRAHDGRMFGFIVHEMEPDE